MGKSLTSVTFLSLVLASSIAAAGPEDGKLPNLDFPVVATTAKAGEWVLTVNAKQWERFAADPKKGVIFYSHELVEPGEKASTFKEIGKKVSTAPNSIVIPLPKGGSAKVGDVVLTWWQSGSGMQRGIVVDAKDPKAPVVRYLDLDYDNPAKSRDGKTTIGQMDEQLKPDTFAVLKGTPFEVGSTVACKDGKDHKLERVVSVSGDKVLTSGFVGKLFARAKADCTAMPQKPKLKVNDKVMAEFAGNMRPAVVSKVDEKIGRVFVKFDLAPTKESAMAFGRVISKL